MPDTAPEMDLACSAFVSHLWEEGDPRAWATDALCGVAHFVPRLRRQLPGAWRLAAAWQKRELPSQAVPFTLKVLRGVAGKAFEIGDWRLGLLLLLGFHCLLRTGELLEVKTCDFIFGDNDDRAVLNLPSSKTGTRFGTKEAITLSDPVLIALLKRRLQTSPSGEQLWRKSPAAFRAAFQHILVSLGLGSIGYKPYSLRRGAQQTSSGMGLSTSPASEAAGLPSEHAESI